MTKKLTPIDAMQRFLAGRFDHEEGLKLSAVAELSIWARDYAWKLNNLAAQVDAELKRRSKPRTNVEIGRAAEKSFAKQVAAGGFP